MKLWLDDLGPTPAADDPDKLTRPVPEGWTHAQNYRDAQKLVLENRGNLEAMSLDHDLGKAVRPCYECELTDHDGAPGNKDTCEDCHCHTRPSTGCDFVTWLAGTRSWPKQKPVVHSANPSGSADMRALIDRYYEGT